MWIFYADEHRGICLEFDGLHPAFSPAQKMQYGAKPPKQDVDPSGPREPLACHKSNPWKFQQEWRINSTTSSVLFPPEALRRVILGYRFPEFAFADLAETLTRGGYHLVIDQMQRRPNSYDWHPVRRGH